MNMDFIQVSQDKCTRCGICVDVAGVSLAWEIRGRR